MHLTSNIDFTQENELQLRHILKRCRPEVIEAAIEFRKSGNINNIEFIVVGIIERFIERELRFKLHEENRDQLHLFHDLGTDSLVMVEIANAIEVTLNIPIPNENLYDLQTLKNIKQYLKDSLNTDI